MPKDINLIPTSLSAKNASSKLIATFKIIDIIGTIIFFLGVLVAISLILVNSQELKVTMARQEQLKSSIKNMQKTEQQYTLVKDRIDKIEEILAKTNAVKDVERFDVLKADFPPDLIFSQIEIKGGSVETTVIASTYSSLAQTFASLVSSGLYKQVVLSSFIFNPETGYLFSIKLSS